MVVTLTTYAQTETQSTTETEEVVTKKELRQFKQEMKIAAKKEHKGRNLQLIGGAAIVVGAVLLPEVVVAGAVVYIIGYFIDKRGVRLRYNAIDELPE